VRPSDGLRRTSLRSPYFFRATLGTLIAAPAAVVAAEARTPVCSPPHPACGAATAARRARGRHYLSYRIASIGFRPRAARTVSRAGAGG